MEPTQVILHEVSEPEGVGRRERRGGKGVSQTQGKSLKDTEIRESRKRDGREDKRGNMDLSLGEGSREGDSQKEELMADSVLENLRSKTVWSQRHRQTDRQICLKEMKVKEAK